MVERLHLVVEDGIAARMTELAGGERKRGAWLGTLVSAMHEQSVVISGSELETTKLAMEGLIGRVKLLEGRLLRLEQRMED